MGGLNLNIRHRMNEQIRGVRDVRLIDETGKIKSTFSMVSYMKVAPTDIHK